MLQEWAKSDAALKKMKISTWTLAEKNKPSSKPNPKPKVESRQMFPSTRARTLA